MTFGELYFKEEKVPHGKDMLLFTGRIVCKSAAGYYVGEYCKTVESPDEGMIGLIEPYERYSGYYPDEKSAQKALKEEDYGR